MDIQAGVVWCMYFVDYVLLISQKKKKKTTWDLEKDVWAKQVENKQIKKECGAWVLVDLDVGKMRLSKLNSTLDHSVKDLNTHEQL